MERSAKRGAEWNGMKWNGMEWSVARSAKPSEAERSRA